MENIPAMGLFIMIIIFTCINLSILHSKFFIVYFSGEAMFRHVFYAFLFAFVEVGLIVKLFSGIVGVLIAIIKFLLKLILILAVIAAVGFILAKILPLIIPKTGPTIARILQKIHIFNIKPAGAEDEQTDETKESPVSEEGVDGTDPVTNQPMACSKCGNPLPEGAIFCQRCGEKI